ncbi:hypothetical protein C8J56DRAFT_1060717 [Mycena floridula]|nr:hypothetical protein C8J56DRAFT_1060717 [Mycena floridula]
MSPTLVSPTLVLGAFVFYQGLVRLLRTRRYNAIHAAYQQKYENKTLTVEEAQKVMAVSTEYDMPMLLNYALAFALFKTYAIPSISELLATTKELGSKERVSKRYADTEILISTWISCPFRLPSNETPDPRAMIALARVNWLHSKYNIANDDYLYTLGLFIFEPWAWAERYGWRALSPLEKHSYYIYWLEIGKRMGIKHIPDDPEVFKRWCVKYEEEYMVPAQSNHDVAGHTTEELLHVLPEAFGIKNFARRLSVCALEEHVRKAMMFPKQPRYLYALLEGILHSVSFVQYHFCLPRTSGSSAIHKEMPKFGGDGKCPRMSPTRWQAIPWYKPASTTSFGSFLDWLLVRVGRYDAIPGPQYRSAGYKLEEMGPLRYEKSGQAEVLRAAEEMYGQKFGEAWVTDSDSKKS